MYNIGQHVKAVWTNGQLYGATIQQFNGSHYLVSWDDGSPPLWVAANQVQPDGGFAGPTFGPGQHVRAQWTNGNWYGARILQTNGAHYEVAWDDGSPNLWITAAQIQPDNGGGFAPPPAHGGGFMPGQHVRAQWTNGNWYGARILQINGAHYEVAWDDGSPNLWITQAQIQPDNGGAGIAVQQGHPGMPMQPGFGGGGGMPMQQGYPGGGGMPMQPGFAGGGGMPMQPGFGGGFAPGQHVSAQWTNGNWYGARILQINGAHYEVAWDDGSPNLWITAAQVRPG